MHLQTVMLYVKDLPRMAAFYRTLLGVRPTAATLTDTWVEFRREGVSFALHAIPPHIAVEIKIQSPPVVREETPFKLHFAMENIEGHRSQIEAMGGALVQRPWGGWAGIDPEGNVFGMCPYSAASSAAGTMPES